MKRRLPFVLVVAIIALPSSVTAEPVQFNRDIRPILAEHCFNCHGPDRRAREGDLRLDVREAAVEAAIEPGDPAASELIARITSGDADERMPPPDSNIERLSAQQIALVRDWIEQGAEYDPHWSLVPPTRPKVPAVKDADWPRSPIDRFVLARLEAEGLAASPEADPATLIRRLYFDLIGLPPSPAEVDAFANDAGGDA
jgi:hypothetical protein